MLFDVGEVGSGFLAKFFHAFRLGVALDPIDHHDCVGDIYLHRMGVCDVEVGVEYGFVKFCFDRRGRFEGEDGFFVFFKVDASSCGGRLDGFVGGCEDGDE